MGDEIFFVRCKRHHRATFCQGDFFGEMAFLYREVRSADVMASTPVNLYASSREHCNALVKSSPAVGGGFFEPLAYAVSKRLRVADTELRVLEER
jgi:CRP-like cAMP-binding protein